MNLDDCEKIFDQVLDSKSESEFCYVIDPLFNEYDILSLGLRRGSIYWRARVIKDEVYNNISDLNYPPPEYTRQGRLNGLGSPCFYIATREETALAEVNATKDQRVQLAGFRIKNEFPLRLAIIGEYANVQKNGYMHFAGQDPDMTITRMLNNLPRQEALKILYIDKFFAKILADPKASDNDYMHSRVLSQILYSKTRAKGIVFPSVKDDGGFNIAVQAEQSVKSFHNVMCFVVVMGKSRRFGLTEFNVVESAKHLDDNNNFIWRRGNDPKIIGMYGMTKEEFDEASKTPRGPNDLVNFLKANDSA